MLEELTTLLDNLISIVKKDDSIRVCDNMEDDIEFSDLSSVRQFQYSFKNDYTDTDFTIQIDDESSIILELDGNIITCTICFGNNVEFYFSSQEVPILKDRIETLYSLVDLIVVGDDCEVTSDLVHDLADKIQNYR